MAFKKPMDLEQQRLAQEAEMDHAITHDQTLRRAVSLCNELHSYLSSQERRVVSHCQSRLALSLSPSSEHERWLLDIERALRERLVTKVSALIAKCAKGDPHGEHPDYPRSDWPDLQSNVIPALDYWFWVVRLTDSKID